MKEKIRYWSDYLWSFFEARRRKDMLRDIQAYCMFIGYPRSGHTLHGALLNAHPEMVIAHELDALHYIERGIGRDHLYMLLLRRDRWFQETKNSQWYEFSYRVPNQWQGRFRQLKIIGDKKGGTSTSRLRESPELLSKLRDAVRVPLKMIHVVRNPFDNIATMSRRGNVSMEDAMRRFFNNAETNATLIQSMAAADSITLRHEDMIADPRDNLRQLVNFVGLQADEAYLSDCASIVFRSPSKSRQKAQWDDRMIANIQSQIDKYSFLQGYTFEN